MLCAATVWLVFSADTIMLPWSVFDGTEVAITGCNYILAVVVDMAAELFIIKFLEESNNYCYFFTPSSTSATLLFL